MPFTVNLSAYASSGGAPFTYNSGTAYVVGDVVLSGGTKFKCKANSTGNTPATGANTFWVEIVEKTIGGVSRDYQTIAAWISACPTLTTANQIWKGLIYKEGNGVTEWAETMNLSSLSGKTDADRFVWLEPATGQGFIDNANKLTNALRYNNANGVANNRAGATVVDSAGSGYSFFRGLQLSGLIWSGGAGTFLNFSQCIIKSGSTAAQLGGDFGGIVIINSAIYSSISSTYLMWAKGNNYLLSNCTFYNTGSAARFAAASGINNLTVKNSTIFGYTLDAGDASAFNAAASTYNITDLATFSWSATGNIVSAVASNQFTSLTGGSEDFRIKAGADVINAGVRDQTNTNDLDIVGSARSTTTPTIGAWEFPSITYTYARPTSDITTQWTPSTGTDHYALIDETTANDADYIYATAAGQTDEVRLASMSAPQAGTDLLVNYKVAGIVGSASVTMSLRQGSGGTLIATDTAKAIDNTYQLVVPAATWASVTDWTDLRLRFVSA
jgi:hypothetical protein